jgi:hypothetical protein
MAFVVVMTGCGSVLTLRAGIASESSMLRGWIRLWLVAIALIVGMLLINIFIGQLSPANLF